MTDEKNNDPSIEELDALNEGAAAEESPPEEAVPEEAVPEEAVPEETGAEAPEDQAEADVSGDEAVESDLDPEKVLEEAENIEGAGAAADGDDLSEEDAEAAMLKMLEDLPEEEAGSSADEINFDSASVSKAEFQQLSQPAAEHSPRNIDLLMDVDLPIAIELGRTKMSISDILSLGPGSVVELNKLAGEPVDLLVNNTIVARGEVVVVDENFGLRITQLMTPEERLKTLGKE